MDRKATAREMLRLLEKPFTSSVLTLPAVNMGQVLLKGEDCDTAERVMRRRMKLALAFFCRERGKESGSGSLRMRRIQKRSGKSRRMVGGAVERRV